MTAPLATQATLDTLDESLQAWKAQQLAASALAARVRPMVDQLDDLPPRFAEVLAGLLDRIESSALFSEESCSFSQRDLQDALQTWLDRAREKCRPAG
jgi:hypothetical protein